MAPRRVVTHLELAGQALFHPDAVPPPSPASGASCCPLVTLQGSLWVSVDIPLGGDRGHLKSMREIKLVLLHVRKGTWGVFAH